MICNATIAQVPSQKFTKNGFENPPGTTQGIQP